MKVLCTNQRVPGQLPISVAEVAAPPHCSLPLTFAATFTGTLYIRAAIHGRVWVLAASGWFATGICPSARS